MIFDIRKPLFRQSFDVFEPGRSNPGNLLNISELIRPERKIKARACTRVMQTLLTGISTIRGIR